MATAAAAAVAAARRKVFDYFLAQNAVTPENAVAYAADRRLQQRQFERSLANGTIKEAAPGRYYVDIPAWRAWRNEARKRVTLLLLFLVLALMIVLGLTLEK